MKLIISEIINKRVKNTFLLLSLLVFIYIFSFSISNIFNSYYKINNDFSFRTNSNIKIMAKIPFLLEEGSTVSSTTNLKKYFNKEKSISFFYPEDFVLNELFFTGSELKYHIIFYKPNSPFYGFIEEWDLNMSLPLFLQQSISTSDIDFKEFKESQSIINTRNTYRWDHIFESNGTLYKGTEIFFEDKDRVYRISYFIPLKSNSKKFYKIYINIVNSFEPF